MNIFPNAASRWVGLSGTQRGLLACATVVFFALLSFYVHLLHESVASGESLRHEQRLGVGDSKSRAASLVRTSRENTAQPLAITSRR
jgi:hypothetical protein